MSIGWLSRKMREARSNQRGLTLIEMCITIVILAMITGVLSAAFVTSINSAANSAQRVSETNDAQIIAGFLTRDAQATGGTDPSTGLADPTLGVSITDPGCNNVPGTLAARFKWIDRSNTSIPGTVRVAAYSWVESSAGQFEAQELVRTTCFATVGQALDEHQSFALAHLVVEAPTVTCDDDQSCAGLPFPDTISMEVSESSAVGTAPYTFKLTASVRPQNTLQATPTVPAPLVLLGRSTCADGTTGLGFSSSLGVTVNVSGRAFIDATNSGSCEALSMGIFNTLNADELNILTGGTCSGITGCPSSGDINHYSPELADPYAGLPAPSTTGLPEFNTSSCNGSISPGVYNNTLSVTNGNSCSLNPGIYILKGGLSVTVASELVGTGVLLYIPSPANGGSAGATFNTNGAARISLTPPESGPYTGINIWQAGTNTVQVGLTVGIFFSNDVNILGTIYAPNAQVRDVASYLGGEVNIGGVVAQTLVVNTSFISTLNINPLRIALPETLPQWTVNQPGYSTQLLASGGLPPYTYSVSGGSLPAGLSLNATTGVISGTPTSAGTANFTIRVVDGFGDARTRQFSLVINQTPAIQTSLPNWTQTFDYQDRQLSTGTTGTTPFTWSISSGSLPPGLTLSSSGLVSGSPTTTGTFPFTVRVVDGPGATATRDYSIRINPVPTIATPTSLPTPWNANNPYPSGNTGTVTANTGTAPFTWSENLPPGLSINSSTGAITGTPSNAGSYPNASITVIDAAGATATRTYPMVINPQLGFQSGTPSTAEQGVPYTFTVVPSGGTPPFTFTSTGFPVAGVNMVGNTISGTPTTVGSFPITVRITDGTGASTTRNYTFTVAPPVTFTGTLRDWTVGRDYSPPVSLTANGGAGTRTFSAIGLPPGMSISTSGSVTGTPTAIGDYTPQITISDTAGGSYSQTLPIRINPTPVIATDSLPAGERTVPYAGVTLAVQPGTGTAPVTWQATGLSASGLTLSSDGVISGTPNAGGTFTVTLRAFDAAGVASPPVALQLVIAQAPEISPQTLPQWTVNVPDYTAQINAASGGSGDYTYAVTSGSFPPGLTMSTTGAITGTPTASGTFNFTVTATDSLGGFGTQTQQIIINAVPVITTNSLPGAVLNSAYNAPIARTGGTPNFVWSHTGALPAGLSLDTGTGAISGTPTETGTFPISVTVADALGVASAPKDLTVTVGTFGMTSMAMRDDDNDGRVDRLVVTFNTTLAPSSNTAQWTLANHPSGGTLQSVSTSGNVATLVLSEGGGAHNTAVGSFTAALTASPTGIRTTGGVEASFPATAPTDEARPVPTNTDLGNSGSQGRVNANDFITITYSEALSVGSICAGWTDDANPQSTTANVTISNSGDEPITFGAPCTNIGVVETNENYVSNSPRTFAGSTITWTPSTRTLRITLAGGTGGSTNSGQPSENATYTPGTSLADPAGNTSLGNSFTDPDNTRF